MQTSFASMVSLPLLEGVTIWVSVIFVIAGCFEHSLLSSQHIICIVCWFLTQIVIMIWRTVSRLPGSNSTQSSIYRPGVDDGLWCCLLVPLTVLGGITRVYKTQKESHSLDAATLSNDLVFSLISSTTVLSSSRHPCLAFTLVWLLPLSVRLEPVNIVLLVLLCLSSHLCVRRIPVILPKSFSVGEIVVLVQLVSLITWRSVSCLRHLLMGNNTELPQDVSVVAVIGFFSAAMATTAALYFYNNRQPLFFFVTYGVVALVLAFPALYLYLKMDPISWILIYLFTKQKRIFLLLYWLVCSVTAVAVVWITKFDDNRRISRMIQTDSHPLNYIHIKNIAPRTQVESRHSTVIRKYFHFLALGVYAPGLILDVSFLFLGSVVALVVLVLLEAIRVAKVPPLGPVLDEAFRLFVDEKDAGKCIFTHIYLLLGLSAPIWISYSICNTVSLLPLYSGVLSLAVGDTAASVGGSLFGRHKWPGTKKTIEGTLCCVLSQLAFLFLLALLGILALPNVLFLTIAVILVSCYEAFTLQIDNLVLPLLTFALLSVL
ncbi:dolichol kinase-like [Gigantopelta aegis]|uniref:dolichol kinase-like n=1 Tax=Gigantopelta aegis TaxID=1735272 RepID=UPI001B88ADCE|nr:dolichol kinase-like [Gigantopelta aegis]